MLNFTMNCEQAKEDVIQVRGRKYIANTKSLRSACLNYKFVKLERQVMILQKSLTLLTILQDSEGYRFEGGLN
jgi:hypothetical protein